MYKRQELKRIFNILEIYELYRELRKYSKKIILYGSCSEGTDTLESDIDILIISREKDEVKGIINLHKDKLDRKLSPLILSQEEFLNLKNRDKPLYERIKGGITLWEK